MKLFVIGEKIREKITRKHGATRIGGISIYGAAKRMFLPRISSNWGLISVPADNDDDNDNDNDHSCLRRRLGLHHQLLGVAAEV